MSRLGPLRVIKQTNNTNTASVIFFHGSGDTGKGILDWVKFLVEDFSLPHVKFLFPTAPLQSYTPLDGELSNVWFDRLDITPEVSEEPTSVKSIQTEIQSLIKQEIEAGIPLNRIIVGGFSMGGALALQTAYHYIPGLAGVFTLSSFLNFDSVVYRSLKSTNTPLLMFHGERDTLVPIEWGQETYKRLTELGVKADFVPIKNTLHELKKQEMDELLQWISKIVPNSTNKSSL